MNEYYGVSSSSDFFMHYGIKGMKWGVRRYQIEGSSKRTPEGRIRYSHSDEKNHKTPASLSRSMKQMKYKNFTKLMSPDTVAKSKSGSCHDQVMYEMAELRKSGIDPKACFVMEVDDKGHGGMTHSFVYYKDGDKIAWFENAWEDKAGIHSYDSLKDIKRVIADAHNNGTFGNKSKYRKLLFGKFDDKDHEAGESLQELVYKCLD